LQTRRDALNRRHYVGDRAKTNSFFRELKQRKVYRVALGYAVVAWLVIQISATVMPAYHAPEWILPIFITVIALGSTSFDCCFARAAKTVRLN
jgi:hypothetical protein